MIFCACVCFPRRLLREVCVCVCVHSSPNTSVWFPSGAEHCPLHTRESAVYCGCLAAQGRQDCITRRVAASLVATRLPAPLHARAAARDRHSVIVDIH